MDLAAKLQLNDRPIRLLNAPRGVALDVATARDDKGPVLLFVTTAADYERHKGPAVAAARADILCWIAYPKAGQLGTDLNRDRLNELAKADGIQAVRNVAIDDTWSALRFRPAK